MNSNIKQLAENCGFCFYDLTDVDGDDLGKNIEAFDWVSIGLYTKAIIDECVSDEREKLKLYIKYGL